METGGIVSVFQKLCLREVETAASLIVLVDEI